RTLRVDEVAWLAGWATGGLRPDLVVLLDLDPAEGLRRADRPAGPDPSTVQFAEKVRYAFLDRAAKDPKRYLVLDASRPLESVATLIADRLEPLLPPETAAAPAGGAGAPECGAAKAGAPGAGDPAAAPPGMTHAWLFTGPAGSGRSVAARAFAAALQCADQGCGTCPACHTTLAGTHADVRFVVPEGLTVGVNEMRSLVLRAQGAPTQGRWQVLLVEDADRLTEQAGNALLKAIEEPPPRTVFLLCTPSTHPDDISVTIRSRCRTVVLRQPSAEAVASVLVDRDGTPYDTALWAAAAAQGHVGRARRLARDPQARARRDAVLAVPRRL